MADGSTEFTQEINLDLIYTQAAQTITAQAPAAIKPWERHPQMEVQKEAVVVLSNRSC